MASNGSGMAQVKSEIAGNGGVGGNQGQDHPRDQLPTFIYDFLRKERKPELAQKILDEFPCKTLRKSSPSSKVNGAGQSEDPITRKLEALPEPDTAFWKPDLATSGHPSETSFLQEWWNVFWDLWAVGKPGVGKNNVAAQYMSMRNRAAMGVNANGIRFPPGMTNAMPNGMMDPSRQRAAMMRQNGGPQNRNFSQGGQMGQAREGAGMDPSGQGRPQSPMSGDNAPSPNKRARLGENDHFGGQGIGPGNRAASLGPQMTRPGGPGGPVIANGFDGSIGGGQQFMNMPQNARMGSFNAPMNMSMMGSDFNPDVYGPANHVANIQRNGASASASNAQGGALADYQMQLMLLEQQNKKRLLMARQEQDVSQPNGIPNVNAPMPMGQQGMPHVTRGSPVPGAGFDPSQIPGGMSSFMGQAPNNVLMRPGMPFTGPGGAPMGHQQIEMMRRNQQANGGQPPNMPPGAQGPQQPPANENAPRPNPMPPPNVPQAGNNAQRQPSPQQPSAAPPTPGNKAGTSKSKKETKDKKQAPKPQKKSATNATPSTEADQALTPTPNTPITPVAHNKGLLGQQQANAATSTNSSNTANNNNNSSEDPPASSAPPDAMVHDSINGGFAGDLDPTNFNMDFSMHENSDVLDGFDFDSFLQMDGQQAFDMGDPNAFGNFGEVEMGTGGS